MQSPLVVTTDELVPPLSEREILHGFTDWDKPKATIAADRALRKTESVTLKMAREALLVSKEEMARRLSIGSASYHGLEINEANGSATIQSIRKAAATLDCELLLQVRPLNDERFMRRIWRPLIESARTHRLMRSCDPNNRGGRLAYLANTLFRSAPFRRDQKWGRKINAVALRAVEWNEVRP
jgi:transcriptional regulator with XRE-family HTH domain